MNVYELRVDDVYVEVWRIAEADHPGETDAVPAALCYEFRATIDGANWTSKAWLTNGPRITEDRLRNKAETLVRRARK